MPRLAATPVRRCSQRVGRAVASIAVLATILLSAALPAAGQSTVSDAGLSTRGEELVHRFLTILSEEDAQRRADLEAFLAPEFQLLRSDATLLTREAYLANPASVLDYAVEDLVVTGSEAAIVTSYLLSATVTIDGVTRTTTAPRLTVFTLHGDDWLLAAHANFSALSTEPEASPAP